MPVGSSNLLREHKGYWGTKMDQIDSDDLPLHVLWEDDYLGIVVKPPGMPVFSGPGKKESKTQKEGYNVHSMALRCLQPPCPVPDEVEVERRQLRRPQPVRAFKYLPLSFPGIIIWSYTFILILKP